MEHATSHVGTNYEGTFVQLAQLAQSGTTESSDVRPRMMRNTEFSNDPHQPFSPSRTKTSWCNQFSTAELP
jgi:hypothetical protein